MGFLQFLDEDETRIPKKRVSIISAPLADSLSWIGGAEKGPHAILEASQALESFDDELLIDTYLAGFETLPPLNLVGLSSEDACQVICQAVGSELQRERLPVLLGGEHTVTLPAVAACVGKFPDVHVVQIDAHLDLRDQYEDNPLSHACVMRRIHDLAIPFTQVGIRSFSREEWEFVQNKGMRPYLMRDINNNTDWVEEVCSSFQGPVYLTIDMDGLDPTIMPATGTPEPEGLSWLQVTSLLHGLAKSKNIVGMDFVELAPFIGGHHAVYTAAKLIYRTLGYIYQPLVAISQQLG